MYLEKIIEHKIEEIEKGKNVERLKSIKVKAERAPRPRPFSKAMLAGDGGLSVIAEIKRASPSRGDIAPGLEVKSLAQAYREGGAAAISVLTERKYFKGSLEDLVIAREVSGLPVLRKDFIIDPWQIYQSRAAGADAVLLIARLLMEGEKLREFIQLCREIFLQPLVEITGEKELEKALQGGADLVGINNRDLQSFQVNLERTGELASLVPPEVVLVGESGVHDYRDAARLQQYGVHAVLVGEALVLSSSPADKIRELQGVK